ncbi:hypothetical protein [Candidatus Amarolinea dominans]|uniref:hypothetical protein n=1 Tax=Candidatus Amarolinea dominans TaxID=3140696 RepID=UPI001D591826|nr:hypothetical protein [Anaerolineae bacterium]
MEDFAKWFCLNNRQNFTIDPQVNPEDAQYYFRPQRYQGAPAEADPLRLYCARHPGS